MTNSAKWLRRSLCAVAVSLATTANAQQISMETVAPSSVAGIVPQTMASYWAKEGVDVQLSMNQTLTKSLLKMTQGKLDSAIVPPNAYNALVNGKAPYAGMGDQGAALAQKVRSLFSIPASVYHAIVWDDSGIKSWADAEGKRVYIGPPGGAANEQITAMVKAGGLNDDQYEAVKAPWGPAAQSFQDGQFDVLVSTYGLGSQALSELSMSRDIRLLSVLPEKGEPPAGLGLVPAKIPPHTYPGQKNDDEVIAWQAVLMLGVKTDMSDDLAYQLTKSYMENRQALADGNALLRELPTADPLAGVNAPLHPGALRYYREAGIEVPKALLPN
ncbi:TAXI family TRAP transporter solute-binding subunit [Marinobacterium rhizophilum]|uniref:TAXI family TRAP transporter solute-binding subunit n=1 Tax=Marinobacterium rhizophilum TaxID=420402 RepID=UPI0003A667E4|nr:TAXI family TRAP transporter solute-binding subunit [Marinobacterium rhizophilum]